MSRVLGQNPEGLQSEAPMLYEGGSQVRHYHGRQKSYLLIKTEIYEAEKS